MTRIKGLAIRGVLHYLKRTGGGIPDVLGQLPAGSRREFDAPILVSTWYPYTAYVDLLEAVARSRGEDPHTLMPQIGDWLAKQDVGFLFKFVTTFASMETLARRCPLFWRQHCDQGTLECNFIDPVARTARCVIRDVPGMRSVHCELVGGWVRGLSEGGGARGMRVWQTECVTKGASACRFEGEWRG